MPRPLGYHHPREARIRMGAAHLGVDPYEYAAHLDAGERWCSSHQSWQPVDTFVPRKDRVSGFGNLCREAARLRMREYRRQWRTP